jgi:CheY-like chemotaxis protein
MERGVVLATDAAPAKVLAAAVHADGSRLLMPRDAQALLDLVETEKPALMILQREFAGRDALELCGAVRGLAGGDPTALAVVVVTTRPEELHAQEGARAGVTDWLLWPFKETYARTRMHCWMLRQACRWQPAPLPRDEDRRLHALQRLQVLDSPPEERFDRYTRIAAQLFDVPIALVSLIDGDRQWFKSRHGLDVGESPRETAFCAHAILDRAVLQVPDALQDDRFADNPLVTGSPRVRFYAGAPLAAADGSLVGTLCLIDRRARQLEPPQLALLRDLADLVERELASRPASRRQSPSTVSGG